jgi:hypothetical protein
MSDKKHLARLQMLKRISKEKGDELASPVGEKLKSKPKFAAKLAPKKEEEAPELSKAKLILKAKFGDKVDETEEPEESEDGEEAHCEECDNEGCAACEEEETEADSGELDSIE